MPVHDLCPLHFNLFALGTVSVAAVVYLMNMYCVFVSSCLKAISCGYKWGDNPRQDPSVC